MQRRQQEQFLARREALLKYANVAETNPVWAGAWANQPKVFRDIEDEDGTDFDAKEDPAAKKAKNEARYKAKE